MEPLDSTSPVDLTKAFLEGLHLIDFIFVNLIVVCSAKTFFLVMLEVQSTTKTLQEQVSRPVEVC